MVQAPLASLLRTLLLCCLGVACGPNDGDDQCLDSCPPPQRCIDNRCDFFQDYPPNAANSFPSFTLSPQHIPIISAYASQDADLLLGAWDSSSQQWFFHAIDTHGNVGSQSAIALYPNGFPAVLYHDASKQIILYAYLDDQRWHIERVDGSALLGPDLHLAIDQDGTPHATYRDLTHRALRYAVRRDDVWHIEYVDTGLDSPNNISPEEACPSTTRFLYRHGVGFACHLVLQGDSPLIAYHDADCSTLRLARRTETGWSIQVIDGSPDNPVGSFNDIKLDPLGNLVIAYFDAANTALKLRRNQSGSFVIETVDDGIRQTSLLSPPRQHIVGQHPSIAFLPDGSITVAHMDATARNILLSTRILDPNSTPLWKTTLLEPSAGEGFWNQLLIDADGIHYLFSATRIAPHDSPFHFNRLLLPQTP